MAKIDRSGRAPEVTRLDGLPFNLEQWIAREMPGDMGSVGNKEVFKHSDFIFMIVKGPNARNDYHLDPYDEIFYQLKGTIQVGLIGADGHPTVAEVHEGEVLLVSANTPHSPRRPPGTLGLVVERPRVSGEQDGIVWYCDRCGKKLHEVFLLCEDIETQLKATLDAFNADQDLRTCKACGDVLPDPAVTPPWKKTA
ncbi:MAG: 3-hydroxyanthranilate 3,4-dioxygenase [SAR324 cluster bacterium]|nr:3-hydroxyanthranilate 3,4-dioxygenase [SAR324 cluster bacterium]